MLSGDTLHNYLYYKTFESIDFLVIFFHGRYKQKILFIFKMSDTYILKTHLETLTHLTVNQRIVKRVM